MCSRCFRRWWVLQLLPDVTQPVGGGIGDHARRLVRGAVDQAMGILIGENGNSQELAFETLRTTSQSQNGKLRGKSTGDRTRHLVARRIHPRNRACVPVRPK